MKERAFAGAIKRLHAMIDARCDAYLELCARSQVNQHWLDARATYYRRSTSQRRRYLRLAYTRKT